MQTEQRRVAANPQTKPTDLGCESAVIGATNPVCMKYTSFNSSNWLGSRQGRKQGEGGDFSRAFHPVSFILPPAPFGRATIRHMHLAVLWYRGAWNHGHN